MEILFCILSPNFPRFFGGLSIGPERRLLNGVILPGTVLIEDLFQEKPASGSRIFTICAASGLQHPLKIFPVQATSSYKNQRSHHASHHFVQKAGSQEITADKRAKAFDLRSHDCPDWIINLAAVHSKG